MDDQMKQRRVEWEAREADNNARRMGYAEKYATAHAARTPEEKTAFERDNDVKTCACDCGWTCTH